MNDIQEKRFGECEGLPRDDRWSQSSHSRSFAKSAFDLDSVCLGIEGPIASADW
jgi:hypothetical protein